MYIEQEYRMRDIGVLLPPSFVEFLGFVSHQLPDLLTDSLQDVTVSVKPIMLHAAVLAIFASVIAPFGECVSYFYQKERYLFGHWPSWLQIVVHVNEEQWSTLPCALYGACWEVTVTHKTSLQ